VKPLIILAALCGSFASSIAADSPFELLAGEWQETTGGFTAEDKARRSHSLCSVDAGETWKLGESSAYSASETQIAEVNPDHLVCFYERGESSPYEALYFATTTDLGKIWMETFQQSRGTSRTSLHGFVDRAQGVTTLFQPSQ